MQLDKENDKKRIDEQREKQIVHKEKAKKIDAEIRSKQSGILVADEKISEGNQRLQQLLTQAKKISRVELQKAQSMIDMGLTRKRKLETQVQEL